MNFEDVLDQEKNELIESFLVFGEGKRLNKALADLEMNRPEFYKFYQAGQQSKQEEIDKLKLIISEAIAVYDRPMCDETALYQKDDDIYHILIENKYV